MKRKLIFVLLITALGLLPVDGRVLGQTLSSPNYNIENSTLDVGGESSNSTNYQERGSIGDSSDDLSNSTNYKVFPGFLQHAYPGVPAQPTLTNTGGTLYNSLDFIIATGGNPTDTNYAIAISSDDFVTTNFIQVDDTVGASPAWQNYVGWGSGTGERVTGLLPNLTYKIKVKARFGPDTETAYSIAAQASTTSPTLTIAFSGVNSGTSVAGETTTITTGTNDISYGSLVVGTPAVAAHTVTVSTNAVNGYATTLQQDNNLSTTNGKQIAAVSGTNASPAAWPGSVSTGAFGYHTTDSLLCTGTTSRFAANNTYAALGATPEEVACSAAAVTNEATTFVYKLQIGSLQDNGSYQNKLTYITTAQF